MRTARWIAVTMVAAALALAWTAPVGAAPGPNDPGYWEDLYPNAIECYKHGTELETVHGWITNDGKAVTLKPFNQNWPGDHYEVLIVKSGNVDVGHGSGNEVYFHPATGTPYFGPLLASGEQGAVSHWIICKGEDAVTTTSTVLTTTTTSVTTTLPTTTTSTLPVTTTTIPTTTTSTPTTTTATTSSTTTTSTPPTTTSLPSTTTMPTTTTSTLPQETTTTTSTTIPTTTTSSQTTTTDPGKELPLTGGPLETAMKLAVVLLSVGGVLILGAEVSRRQE